MKTSMRHFWPALLLCAASISAQAQEFRIGFVNTDRIFRESAPAKASQTKLEQEFAKREKELVDMGNTLKTASDRFERDAPTLSETQRNNRQKHLRKEQQYILEDKIGRAHV